MTDQTTPLTSDVSESSKREEATPARRSGTATGETQNLRGRAPHKSHSTASAESEEAVDLPATPAYVGPVMSPISQRRQPDEADLGWAAGILDGEGCISITRQTWGETGRRPNFRMRVDIAQNDVMLLREFEWCVGIDPYACRSVRRSDTGTP